MANNPNSQTCLELVTDTFRVIRVLTDEETSVSSVMQNIGFRELCGMLDQWRLDGWLVDNYNGTTSFQLVPGQSDYTVGSTEDIDVPMPPAFLSQVFLTDNGVGNGGVGRTYPVGLAANEEFYRAGRATNTTTAYSLYATYITNYPVSTLKFYPIPAISLLCTIVYPQHIAMPVDITDTLTLSPGFRNAIVCSLGSILTASYPTDATERVLTMASKFQERIREARNTPTPSAMFDPAVSAPGTGGRMKSSRQGLYDIKSNSYANTL